MMYQNYGNGNWMNFFLGPASYGVFSFIAIFAIVDVILKGISLWKSARNGQKYWFIGLLIINSLGILPLIYLFFFEKERLKRKRK